jgi:hypothetical protein
MLYRKGAKAQRKITHVKQNFASSRLCGEKNYLCFMRLPLLIFLFVWAVSLKAQVNLVPNPSFEEYD